MPLFEKEKIIEICKKNGWRLTEPRLDVLKIISFSKRPIKAYDILKKLSTKTKIIKPPTVYRAIEFWQKHNFIHRIESLNAYSICSENHIHTGSQFLICDDCGKVIESHISELPQILTKIIEKNTFKPTRWNFEINGICSQCS
jgi:Fur family zinc uptake transcriptional regulator